MSKGNLSSVTKKFQRDVEELQKTAAFNEVSHALKLRARTIDAQQIGIDADLLGLLRKLSSTDADLSICHQGHTVRLAAMFEEFTRNLLADSAKAINKLNLPYNKLQDNLRDRNRKCVGIALSRIFDPIKHMALDYEAICRGIGSSVPESQKIILSDTALSCQVNGVSVQDIEHLLKLFGIKADWNKVGGDTKVRASLGETKTARTASVAKKTLDRLQELRNNFSHNGIGGPAVGVTDLTDMAKFLLAFSLYLEQLFATEIENYAKVNAA